LTAVVLVVVLLLLVVVLLVLLRAIDRDDLRRNPEGVHSPGGLVAVVGGGFLLGLVYGALMGRHTGAVWWAWLGRGALDGLIVAGAGAFYVGLAQRRRSARRGSGR
jgi:hypothetical protein